MGQTFVSTVEIDGQDALHLVGFQPFLTLLDTENNGAVRAGIQNLSGSIGFFSGTSNPMTIRKTGTVEINAQDALHLIGFQPILTLLDSENGGSVRTGIQNVNGDIGFFSGSSFPMTIHNSGDVTMKGTLNGVDITALAARITHLEALTSQQTASINQLNADVGKAPECPKWKSWTN